MNTPREMEQPADALWWEAGIDYGTSTIKVSIALMKNGDRTDAPISVAFGHGSAPCEVSSMVAYHNGRLHWGMELMDEMGRSVPYEKVIRCPKLGIYYKKGENSDVDHMHNLLTREGKTYTDLLGDHLSEVLQETRKWVVSGSIYAMHKDRDIIGGVPIRARIGVPAAWSSEDCAHMTVAALNAGVEICEVVPEPVAAWASCVEQLQKAGTICQGLKDGDVFAVLDCGAATLDPVLIRLIGHFGKEAKFEILAAPAGSVGSSEQVNVLMRQDVLESLEASGGIDAKVKELGIPKADFMCQLLVQADREKRKLDEPGRQDLRISVPNKNGGYSFQYDIDKGVVTTAIDGVATDAITETHKMIKASPEPVKTILLTGGFSANRQFQKRIKDHFAHENLEVTPMYGNQGPMSARLLVAQGAVSEYYDSIQGSKFLLKNNYYILVDERYNRDRHPDCVKKFNKNGTASQRRDRDPNKVGRYFEFELDPNLSAEDKRKELKEENKTNPLIAPNRLHKVLSKDQVSEDLNPVRYILFEPLVSDPKISASIVYSATDYVDGDCAMHDGYVLNTDETLKPDIKPMRTVSATLDPQALAHHGGFAISPDGNGVNRYEVNALVKFAYKTEATMSVRFELLPTTVNAAGKIVADDNRPLVVPVSCEIWRNTHSHLWNQGD